ncbi:phosphonate ABC transporter, permease protein PhnE [Halopiger djelfimassiliensis]|uniref:phosphonate ABC transporter, permease protein PhnE n=1 Tax=Halopiger djelfimassiliensis TaxID=1293047 RepID=UPI0006776342|nr:phosphonate ABC transporter, permease protein PhnE [Halopiger djelfimassiliensis]
MSHEQRTTWQKHDRRTRLLRYAALVLAAWITYESWQELDIRYTFIVDAPKNLADLLFRMYPPDPAYAAEIVTPMVETINIAVFGTGLAILISLPIAYIGAENTTPNAATYVLGKFVIVATRSVNVIIWALFFVVIFGTGAISGVLAVAFRSIGFVSKLIAEGIEEIDPGQVEAIRAMGGSPIDVIVYGIVPQIKPTFVGVATYRWDINVREATVIGFVGAGGIGVKLDTAINFFQWANVLTILIAILVVVIFSEVVSAYLRKKVS